MTTLPDVRPDEALYSTEYTAVDPVVDACVHRDAVRGASACLAALPDRPLERAELLALATALAADRDAWEPHVKFSDGDRHYVSLHRDANVDIWVLCWTPTNDTGWHDHDLSSGAVAVTQGELVEHNLAIGAQSLETRVGEGQAYSFGPDHIHRMTGQAEASVSIHCYSPPLWRMGQYAISSTGVLRRTSVSYADELRPID
jgi:quercetin dioxygenase-like cupin family protein